MQGRQYFLRLKSHFVKASVKIFDMNLNTNSIAVYFYLLAQQEQFNPSVRYIAMKIGVSKSTAARSMQSLVDANIITLVVPATKTISAKYKINPPNEWNTIEQW